MNGAAPKGILQYTDKQITDLHQRVAHDSTKAGYPVTPSQVNPDHRSLLEEIEKTLGDLQHDITHVTNATMSGDESAKIRIAQDRVPTSIFAKRGLKRRLLEKVGLRKAA